MADKIHLNIVSADGAVLEKMVNYICIPTEAGTVGILSGHLPMLCAIKEGVIRCQYGENDTLRIAVKEGFARIAGDEAAFLVSGAEMLED